MHWSKLMEAAICAAAHGPVDKSACRVAQVKRIINAYKKRGDIDEGAPIAVVSSILDTLGNECIDIVCDTIRAAEKRLDCKIGNVVIDTGSKGIAAGGGEENSAKDRNRVATNMRKIIERMGGELHIAIVGHTGKDPERGERGSNAGRADADVQVTVVSDGGGLLAIRKATITKANELQEGVVVASYTLDMKDTGTCDDDGVAERVSIVMPCNELTPRPAAAAGWGANELLRKALTKGLADMGKPIRPFGPSGPEVTAVPLEAVRTEWHTITPDDVVPRQKGDDGIAPELAAKRKRDRRNQAWSRMLRAAIGVSLVATREIEGVEMVWTGRRDDDPGNNRKDIADDTDDNVTDVTDVTGSKSDLSDDTMSSPRSSDEAKNPVKSGKITADNDDIPKGSVSAVSVGGNGTRSAAPGTPDPLADGEEDEENELNSSATGASMGDGPETPSATGAKTASLAFMITKEQKRQLRDLDYSDEAIAHLTPGEVQGHPRAAGLGTAARSASPKRSWGRWCA